jgi:cell division protein FtsW
MDDLQYSTKILCWWRSIDRVVLLCALGLMFLGVLFVYLNSEMLQNHHSLSSVHFIKKHIIFILLGIIAMLGASLLSVRSVFVLSFMSMWVILALLILTALMGVKIKGARRWLQIFGFSIQISELLKVIFPVFIAWLIERVSIERENGVYSRTVISSIVCCIVILILLIRQPDFGTTGILLFATLLQLFVYGIRVRWLAIACGFVMLIATVSYFTIPHVKKRVNAFVTVVEVDKFGQNFQAYKANQAISAGKMFGVGPAAGRIKRSLPDVHADFIFAAICEEFGFFIGVALLLIYFLMFLRILICILRVHQKSVLIALTGMCAIFSIQFIVNIATNLGVMPPKGTTMQFISYGGSSLIASALFIGYILAITKKRT